MVLSFRSSSPERFQIIGTDPDGRRRVATATREAGAFNWDLQLQHPSGRNWRGTYHGNHGILDALGELMSSHDVEFKQDKARGDRPHEECFDYNRAVVDGDVPPITPIARRY